MQCVLTPELTEGPYYVSGEKLRRDITEGKAGTPLLLNLKVINARHVQGRQERDRGDLALRRRAASTPATWPATPGTNFLRGGQKTNANGIAQIKTIYPGFYNGRAVHIHVKVHVKGNVVHTGQLFFPAAITQAVYARAPYSSHGATPDTSNAQDSIYRNGGRKGLLSLKKSGSGYVGTISMGVHV